MRWLASAFVAILIASPTFAQDIRVIDGNTFEMDGEVIRLWGIDAPEAHQLCGVGFPAGELARITLIGFVTRLGSCEAVDQDRWGRTIARCTTSDGRDISAEMVEWGMAFDYPEYSGGAYADEMQTARRNGRGRVFDDCPIPWEIRRRS